jgi:predicted SnoaL-like aldol condensation-catalyzing enzyme
MKPLLALFLAFFVTAAALPAVAADTPRETANKKAVVEFYNAAINEKNYDKAKTYLGATYIQHNPQAADGPEGLKGFIDFLKNSFPAQKNEIKRAMTDGDYVILHVHSVREPGSRGRAIVDIFRVDDKGKVVEHWDVIQDVPEKALNTNTMF